MTKENIQILHMMQAILGSISANFRAIFLKFSEGKIIITFIIEKDLNEDREEIDDIIFEFEALQETSIKIEKVVIV